MCLSYTRKMKRLCRILMEQPSRLTAKVWHVPGLNDDQYEIVQMHPSDTYEDLIEGLKPVTFSSWRNEVRHR